MKRLRVLFLTPQLPYPPHQGTALRNFGLIQALAQQGHRVTLLSFAEADQPLVEQTPLAALCDAVIATPTPDWGPGRRLRALLAGQADMARRRWSELYLATLRNLLARQPFDAIHIEGLEMAPYLDTLREAAPSAMLIYDAHNAEYALQARIAGQDWRIPTRWPLAAYSYVQARRLIRFEAAVCRGVDRVIAVSQADAALLRKLPHRTPVVVVHNAIFTDDYQPANFSDGSIPHPALVFTGKMDFRPNVDAVLWFSDHILPLVRRAVAGAHFTAVGHTPHPRLNRLRGRPGVTLTGRVEDVRPYLRAADVYVAPLRMGSGTRFKLLEAMAMERAVVSTRIGAEGLDAQHGNHLLLADSPAEFAEAVIALLQDQPRRTHMGQQAARLVRERYDWRAITPRLEAIYDT